MSYHRLQLAVGLLSASLLAFQIILLQVFSFIQWYHFAYMVISVALLGFGASGTVLSIARKWFTSRSDVVLRTAMLVCGVSMPVVLVLMQLPFARFESYLLLTDWRHVLSLFVTYLLLAVPFFCGALAIGLAFTIHAGRVGGLYFANLVGSGLGGPVGFGLLNLATPGPLVGVVGIFSIAAALAITRHRSGMAIALPVVCLLVNLYFSVSPPPLSPSEYKDLSAARMLPDIETVVKQPGAHGMIHVLRSPALRRAPGLSLTFRGEVPSTDAVFVNGDGIGSIPALSDSTSLLNYTTAALPYTLQAPRKVLVLGSGSGEAAAHTLRNGAESIVAVEPHPGIVSLLAGTLTRDKDSLPQPSDVALLSMEPRTFLARDTMQYDLVVLPTVGSFEGSAGLSALQEQYGLTVEAFADMWRHLAPDGLVSVTVWMDYPYRNPLRLLATLVDMLDNVGVSDPSQHLAAIRSWGTMTLVVQRSPITKEQIKDVHDLCSRLWFDPVLLPGLPPEERVQYIQGQDPSFFEHVDVIMSGAAESLYATYPFRVYPTTDDRPYFSQFARWESIGELRRQFGARTVPFLELGTLIVAVTLIQLIIAAVLLIIVPLFKSGWVGRGRRWTFVYFAGLGIGFMFLEVIIIQRFILYFGHAVFAVAAVFMILLVGSGIGSLLSARFSPNRRTLTMVTGAIAAAILLTAVILPMILESTIHFGVGPKVLIAAAAIGPVAVLMGCPFPLGLRYVAQREQSHVPWAWGINGCLSVTSTAAATLLMAELGAFVVLLMAAGAYACVSVSAAMLDAGHRGSRHVGTVRS